MSLSVSPQIQIQIDLAASLVALAAIGVTIWLWRHQSTLEREKLRLERDSGIVDWCNSALSAFCAAELVLREEFKAVASQHEYEMQRLTTMSQLSASVDSGRLYFPNSDHGRWGVEKETAFQGLRHPVLDRLVWTYDLLRNEAAYQSEIKRPELRARVTKWKREFVSEVQSEVDPRRRVRFLTGGSR